MEVALIQLANSYKSFGQNVEGRPVFKIVAWCKLQFRWLFSLALNKKLRFNQRVLLKVKINSIKITRTENT
jgi:hypothetical protein